MRNLVDSAPSRRHINEFCYASPFATWSPLLNFDYRLLLSSFQNMAINTIKLTPYVLIALSVFIVFVLAAKATRRLITRFTEKRRKHRNVGMVLGRLAEGGLILLGLLIALVIAVPSFKPAQLVQLLGIGSVAIGFAFRDILQNFLAGILILLTEPFRIEDQIIMGGYEGTVEKIETRATFIKTYDGRRVVIPNATLFNESVLVNTAYSARRLQYDIGIGYGDDIDKARNIVLEVLRGLKEVLSDPAPEALVVDLAGSSVNLRARWWIQPPRQIDVVNSVDAVLTLVKSRLTAAGIDLPFPTQQVLFHDQTESSDGDRKTQREGWPAGSGAVPRSQSIAQALRGKADKEEQ